MTCGDLRSDKLCTGCDECAAKINDDDALILRYYSFQQEKLSNAPCDTWLSERDYAFTKRSEMFISVEPHVKITHKSLYRRQTRLIDEGYLQCRSKKQGNSRYHAITHKGYVAYKLRRLHLYGIPLEKDVALPSISSKSKLQTKTIRELRPF